MGIMIKRNTKFAVVEEVTEGTLVIPTLATDFLQTLSDGAELNPAQELVNRSVYAASIGQPTPKTTIRSATATIPVELRAGETEGAAPEYDLLLESGMGAKKQSTASTTKTGNTASQLEIEDADISKYAVNDIIMVKEAGAFHISAISAVDATPGFANIQLQRAAGGAFSDNVEIAAVTQYTVANSGHKSLSVTKWLEDARREHGIGMKVTNITLNNFTTGALPDLSFGLEGLNYDFGLQALPVTPDFDVTSPAAVLGAKLFLDTTELDINEFSFSLENTLGFVTTTSSKNGRTSSRITERSVTGNFLPYKQDDATDIWQKFSDNDEFAILAFTGNCPATGEYSEVAAFWFPQNIITEVPEADQDGNIQTNAAFTASTGESGDQNEVYIAFM